MKEKIKKELRWKKKLEELKKIMKRREWEEVIFPARSIKDEAEFIIEMRTAMWKLEELLKDGGKD